MVKLSSKAGKLIERTIRVQLAIQAICFPYVSPPSRPGGENSDRLSLQRKEFQLYPRVPNINACITIKRTVYGSIRADLSTPINRGYSSQLHTYQREVLRFIYAALRNY